MKAPAYFLTLLLGLACVGLCVVLIVVARGNRELQVGIQQQQAALNNSVLGAQAQQISSSVLQDIANASATNRALHDLLVKYGYRIEPSRTPVAAAPAAAATAAETASPAGPAAAQETATP